MYKKYFDIYNRNADISYAFHLRDFDATFSKNPILFVNQENSKNFSGNLRMINYKRRG